MIRAAVVTISDKGLRGEREDTSGPLLCDLLAEMSAQVIGTYLIPDETEQITALLARLADTDGVDLVLTTSGTGPSPRDVTPEATRAVIEREMPGLAELLRWDGYQRTPFAVLSRGVAGIRRRTLIVNLPGSPKAVREGMEVLAPLLPAAIALIKDETPVDGLCAPQ
ncbi:MAG: MogA/MoaB family molybdenum cofactor biosynthesis protein [Chloroflexi bacterium]|nr:MAG: MogA/MoaB family molybdenum cofactor biosynthesis protein [Chloroflexota bacterium]